MRILITGANGQLGRDLAAWLSRTHQVRGVDLPGFDIADERTVAAAMAEWIPEAVINCAAFTRVDDCEKAPAAAWRANADGPRVLARILAPMAARLIQISTDYVFDGRRAVPRPYLETDPPAPLSEYGRSKLAGEEAVLAASPCNAVVRTAWLYGIHGANFLKTMLRLAMDPDRTQIRVVDDQFGSPTWSWPLAQQIGALVASGGSGIYHATSQGHASWFDLARYFLGKMGVSGKMVPCTTAEYPTPAARPANSILDNHRLRSQGIHLMPPWRDSVDHFVRAHGQQLMAEAEKERR